MAEDMLGASRCQAGPSADMERLQALICAHMVALETLSKRLDAEALLRTFTPLLELVREMGGTLALRKECSLATLDDPCLEEVPSSARLLSEHARDLALEGSDLKTLPAWLGRFQQLQTLSIAGEGDQSCCHLYNGVLESLPESIGCLELKTLRLSRLVALRQLPHSLGRGKLAGSLERLDIAACGLTVLPDSMCMLSRLKSLSITECWMLQRLPARLGELKALSTLTLEDLLELNALPETFGSLRLATLSINCCELQRMPESMADMTSLTSLAICGCELRDLANLEGLTALRRLKLHVESECFSRRQQSAGDCKVFLRLARALPRLRAVT